MNRKVLANRARDVGKEALREETRARLVGLPFLTSRAPERGLMEGNLNQPLKEGNLLQLNLDRLKGNRPFGNRFPPLAVRARGRRTM